MCIRYLADGQGVGVADRTRTGNSWSHSPPAWSSVGQPLVPHPSRLYMFTGAVARQGYVALGADPYERRTEIDARSRSRSAHLNPASSP